MVPSPSGSSERSPREEERQVTLAVTHNKHTQILTLAASTTLWSFVSAVLSSTVQQPASLYKLIIKGRTYQLPSETANPVTLASLSLPAEGATKAMLLSSSPAAVSIIDATTSYERRREAAKLLPQAYKVRDTSDRSSNPYTFGALAPLPSGPGTPFYEERMKVLMQLRDDKGIQEIMKERQWSVGTLGELHPHTDPMLLGVNENGGVRIRTV